MAAELPTPIASGTGLKIVHAGLFRMATKSMATAYNILGYKTHHGLMESVTDTPWTLIEQAAEAKWPSVPGGPSPPRAPFTRAEWDALFGAKYDATSDLGSPFALELARAYPEAKVVVVQRDFDSWWPSFKSELIDSVMTPQASIFGFVGWYIMGIRAVQAMRKVHFGHHGARTPQEIEQNARRVYEEYYATIRREIPPERRLEYKMGDGWGPLCEFLGKEVPDMPFPRVNDRKAHENERGNRTGFFYKALIKAVLPVAVAVAGVGVAWVYWR